MWENSQRLSNQLFLASVGLSHVARYKMTLGLIHPHRSVTWFLVIWCLAAKYANCSWLNALCGYDSSSCGVWMSCDYWYMLTLWQLWLGSEDQLTQLFFKKCTPQGWLLPLSDRMLRPQCRLSLLPAPFYSRPFGLYLPGWQAWKYICRCYSISVSHVGYHHITNILTVTHC